MEFWSARDLMPVLGYSTWRQFFEAIERAKESSRTSNQVVANHFLPTPAKSSGGPILGLIATAKKHKLVELTTS